MKYFAYGSNMDIDRLKERKVNFTSRESARLIGYKLSFNKKAQKGNYAFANIEPADNTDIVEGGLYEIDENDIAILDKYEGYPNHYDKIEIEIFISKNKSTKAVTYIAKQDKVINGLKPTKEYLRHLFAGKDLMSEKYFNSLNRIETFD